MAKHSKHCVVDTNVPVVANKVTHLIPDEELECALACVEKIIEILEGKRTLVLDEGGEIFEEYKRKKRLDMSGQPGVGDAFMLWVKDNQWNRCKRVSIQKTSDGYAEFPASPSLNAFDKSDKKFVAVANACGKATPILVALDTDWWIHREALSAAGVKVDFLCPAPIKRIAERKKKR